MLATDLKNIFLYASHFCEWFAYKKNRSEILGLTLNITELVKSPVQNDGGHYFDNNKRFFYYAFSK